MKKYLRLSNSIRFLAFLTIVLSFGQCTKDDTTGVITVVDAVTGAPLAGATVTIFVDGDDKSGFFLCDYGYVKEQVFTTNSSGVIKQCFKLPALISVVATYSDLFVNYTGEGKLNLMEHETTSITIKMN